MWLPRTLVALVCTFAPAFAQPKDAEPAASVVTLHRDTVNNIKRAIDRTTHVTLGTGSVLAIAPDPALLDAGIEIRLEYDQPATLAEDIGEHSAAFATAKAIERATKLKATGYGASGTANLTITAEDTGALLAALPKIVGALASTAAPAAGDHAAALQELERMYMIVKSDVLPDLGLRGRMFSDAPPRYTLGKTELVKQLRATKPASAVAARKRWRAGHVTIAMAGGFAAKDTATIEKIVRDGLKGWSFTARPERRSAPVRTGETVRVAKTGNPKTLIALGVAIDAADARAALALDIACGVIRERVGTKLQPSKLRALVVCKRSGKRIELVITIPGIDDPADADALVATVTGELRSIVATGPTAAQLEEPQSTQLRRLNPLLIDRGPKPRDLVEDPPLPERVVAADEILAIKRADVAAALKAHLDPKAFIVIIGTP